MRLDRAEAKSHAVAAENDADAAGDVDASRRAAFVRARADAKSGAVDAALAAYAALLLDMAESPRDVAAPAPDVSFRASAARRYARLAARRDPSSDAATLALDDAVADVREYALRLGLDDALAYPDELRNVHNPRWARWRGLLASAETRLARRDARGAGAILDEAATLCGAHTRDTDARTHARVALLRAHVARRVAERDGRDPAKDIATAESAAATLAKAATWAWSSDAAHDRDTMRLCATEAASAFAARAAAEARAARAEWAEDGGDEASGDAPDLPSHPPPLLVSFVSRSIRGVRSRRASRVFVSRRAHRRGGDERVRARERYRPRNGPRATATPRRRRKPRETRRAKNSKTPTRAKRDDSSRRSRARALASDRTTTTTTTACASRTSRRRTPRSPRRATCTARRVAWRRPRRRRRRVGRFSAPGFVATQWYEPLSAPASAWKKFERARGYESSDWCISW